MEANSEKQMTRAPTVKMRQRNIETIALRERLALFDKERRREFWYAARHHDTEQRDVMHDID